MSRTRACVITLVMFATSPLYGGTYSLIAARVRNNDPNVPGNVAPFAIVHPLGYTGAGGTLTIRVCVRPGSEVLIPSVQWALSTWNSLSPRYENCRLCQTWEEGAPSPGPTNNFASAVLHELGHCAMALGHPNLEEVYGLAPLSFRTGSCDVDLNGSCGDATSFSESVNSKTVLDTNGLRGDGSDQHDNDCDFDTPLGPLSQPPLLVADYRQPREARA